jgi:hypothetical protein
MVRFRTVRFIAASTASIVMLQSVSLLPMNVQKTLQSTGMRELLPAAVARDGIRYKPPKLKRAIRTVGTGSRAPLGCDRGSKISLIPLVPDNHVGQTTAARPTLLAYLSGVNTAEFSLVEPGVAKPLLVQTVQPDAQGLVRIQIPDSSPELEPGKEYRWSLSVICNPNRRSQDIFAQSMIQRIQLSEDLNTQLVTAESDQVRGRLYAESGLWYDALAVLSKADQTDPDRQALQQDFATLLDQVGLNIGPIPRKTARSSVSQ